MTNQSPSDHGYRFPPEIISHAVWLHHRDRRAATRFFRKLLKRQGSVPRRLITDKLRSYAAARRAVMPSVVHATDCCEGRRSGCGMR